MQTQQEQRRPVNHAGRFHKGVLLSPIPVSKMTKEQWLQYRKHGPEGDRKFTLGGSDVGVTMGLSPWTTIHELWDQKKGIEGKVPKNENTDAFERGNVMEKPIAEAFKKDLEEIYGVGNVILGYDDFMYGHKDYPFMIINYDAYVLINIDGEGDWRFFLVEIKTTNSTNFDTHRDWRNGIVPAHYDAQCRYYMKCTDVSGIFIVCAWGFDKNDRAHVLITRDTEQEDYMMECATEFIQSLEDNEPPALDQVISYDKYMDYWGRKYAMPKSATPPKVEIPQEHKPIIKEILKTDALIELSTRRVEDLVKSRNEKMLPLLALLEESKEAEFILEADEDGEPLQTVYIRRSESYSRDSFDEKRFWKEQPDLFKEFTEITKTLNTALLLIEQKDVAECYVIPGVEFFDVNKFASEEPDLYNEFSGIADMNEVITTLLKEKYPDIAEKYITRSEDSFDEAAFQEDAPGLYYCYLETSSKLNVSRLKEKNRNIAGKYVIEGKAKGEISVDITLYDHVRKATTQRQKTKFGYVQEVKKDKKVKKAA